MRLFGRGPKLQQHGEEKEDANDSLIWRPRQQQLKIDFETLQLSEERERS